jgi:hypothetical protein
MILCVSQLRGFENFPGVAGVLAAVSTAAAVPVSSSFGEVNGIVEAPPITTGPPAAIVEAIVILENIIFSQLLHSPSSTPAYLLTADFFLDRINRIRISIFIFITFRPPSSLIQ